MNKTRIEWCDATLNPVVGCTFNCEYCYARKMNQRFNWIEDFHKPQFFPERLQKLESKKPQVVFMNSLSDIADWKEEWLLQTYRAISQNMQHRYLFLTKRSGDVIKKVQKNVYLALEIVKTHPQVMIGQTVDTQSRYDNSIYADFLSIEPILEPIIIKKDEIELLKWVIIGAETGNRKEKVTPKKEWIDDIVTVCDAAGVPVFMKNSLIGITDEMRRETPWVAK